MRTTRRPCSKTVPAPEPELRRVSRPSAAFVDHAQHDVGSGGVQTPTLHSADFNAVFLDGRYDNYEQVVMHFDRVFDLV